MLAGCGGGGASSTSSSSSTTVTAVDGYIEDATLKDASGVAAIYIGDGKYEFTQSPAYPITLTGGKLKDTNVSFDINLTAYIDSTVISPITTFIGYPSSSTTLSILESIMSKNSIDEFAVDYIDINDSNLAKLSRLLYVILKEPNLTTAFRTDLENNNSISSLDDIFALATQTVDRNVSGYNKINYKLLLSETKDINTSAVLPSGYESKLKVSKIVSSYKNTMSPAVLSILKTGQTTCYDDRNSSQTISCSDIHALKGDGYYQKGAARSFTRDDTKEVVVDNATHLMWQDNNDTKTVTKHWSDVVEYCQDLTLGGYDDWRLPTVDELMSISDKGRHNPAIDPTFQNVVSYYYWSSTTSSGNTFDAWGVGFYDGNDGWNGKANFYYVRCVRDNN